MRRRSLMGGREECRQQVENYPGAIFKKFGSMADATAYVTGAGGSTSSSSSPSKRKKISEEEDDEDVDVVYCDGACKGNGHEGSVAGIGVWWGAGDPRSVFASLALRLAHRKGTETSQNGVRVHRPTIVQNLSCVSSSRVASALNGA